MPANLAYIGLGANLGDARAVVSRAAAAIAALPGIQTLRLSPLYRSAPVDALGPDYINAVAQLRTSLSARALLAALQKIEAEFGRERAYRNAPRTLDLDILLYGTETIDEGDLIIPHPRMHLRAFVLRPLLDLDPCIALPQGNAQELLAACGHQELQAL
jgi:2-amino-4-hydroxy-6-hydroxymethyldihydropteridine diphosphokinase